MTDEDDSWAGVELNPSNASDHVIGHVTAFVRELRVEGVDVATNAGIDATRAIDAVGLSDRDTAKAALRATLVSRVEDIETFDRLFPAFWERFMERFEQPRDREPLTLLEDHATRSLESDDDIGGDGDGGRDSETTVPNPGGDDDDGGALDPEGKAESPGGVADDGLEDQIAATVDSSTYSQVGQPSPIDVNRVEGGDGLAKAVDELTRAIGNLKGRRWSPDQAGHRIDARKALRRSFGSGGTVPDIPLQSRRRTAVRAVVLVDVSQSVLDTIDRGFLLRFLSSMYEVWRNVRIFFFDTDVREVTDRFAVPTTAQAIAALREAEAEWGGGTRIGHAFATLREAHPYAIDRETTVFVISDGLEIEEVDQLKGEMAMVSRRSNSVFWLNPLAASAGYRPTCRGMAASLPYVDGLFAFADVGDVEEAARQLRLRGSGGPIGYEYDQRNRVS